jgi:hypothetical protein
MDSLKELYELLKKHDWYYEYSDDFTVWRKGHRNKTLINTMCNKSKEHEKLYWDYRNYVFGQDKEKYPKPECPE